MGRALAAEGIWEDGFPYFGLGGINLAVLLSTVWCKEL